MRGWNTWNTWNFWWVFRVFQVVWNKSYVIGQFHHHHHHRHRRQSTREQFQFHRAGRLARILADVPGVTTANKLPDKTHNPPADASKARRNNPRQRRHLR
jgi:hypothetical protein